MPSIAADSKTCSLKLRRIGFAESELVETRDRTEIPSIGDVIEITVSGTVVRARVFRTDAGTSEKNVTIEADELSGSYVWDTLSALVQFDAKDTPLDIGSSVASSQPHLAFEPTLRLVRQSHALARRFLDRPKPDMTTALRYMKLARRAAWLAFPYVKDEELKRRIVGYKPMSEAEWEQLWPQPGLGGR
jgi:hypothetical protein